MQLNLFCQEHLLGLVKKSNLLVKCCIMEVNSLVNKTPHEMTKMHQSHFIGV
ncbi:hypothetical protein HanIR_Chr01g0023421 [Helianthus annuus]|nr:hypothetical protein HanIR_Chr01g0023421 [Helianthus annuus]